MKNFVNSFFSREVDDEGANFGCWELGGGEESVSEQGLWFSGEAYPETESTVGGREVEEHDGSFGSWEIESQP